MLKNEEYEGLVEGLGTGGEGIIKKEGATVFVPFCLTGERVRFKVLKVKGNIAYGKLLKVLTPSYMRVNPLCSVFGKCGGCDLQHLAYDAQLEFKKNSVESSLIKIGGIYARVKDCVPCEKQYGYRNKLALPIGVDGAGNTAVGFYAERSHRIVPIDNCLIQSPWVKQVISALKQFINIRVKGYDEQTRTGVLRHIVAREIKNKFIFALVVTERINVDIFIESLEKEFKEFTFLLNVNDQPTNVIFGKEWHILRGEGFFEAEENGIKYKAGANTFLQVNDDIRAKLYDYVLAQAEEGAVAIDLYSGGGMLTAMLAKKCGRAYGIEIVGEASRCANELKEANCLQNKMFNICGKVEDKIGEVLACAQGGRKIIVCDPPRKGMERSVVRAIARAQADKIVLVSCNPATLARDLGILLGTLEESEGALVKTGGGNSQYALESVTPFDMFPQTKWCETVAVLSRK